MLTTVYIAFAEWRNVRRQLGLSNDDEVANYLFNCHQQESCSEDQQLRLEYKFKCNPSSRTISSNSTICNLIV